MELAQNPATPHVQVSWEKKPGEEKYAGAIVLNGIKVPTTGYDYSTPDEAMKAARTDADYA